MSTESLDLTNVMYRAFKYSIYGLLTLNIFLFFQEESLAIQQTFSQGMNLGDIIQAMRRLSIPQLGFYYYYYSNLRPLYLSRTHWLDRVFE